MTHYSSQCSLKIITTIIKYEVLTEKNVRYDMNSPYSCGTVKLHSNIPGGGTGQKMKQTLSQRIFSGT